MFTFGNARDVHNAKSALEHQNYASAIATLDETGSIVLIHIREIFEHKVDDFADAFQHKMVADGHSPDDAALQSALKFFRDDGLFLRPN